MKKIKKITVAAVSVMIVMSIAGCSMKISEDESQERSDFQINDVSSPDIPEYPDAADYYGDNEEDFDYDAYEQALEKWSNYQEDIRMTEDEISLLNGFFADCAPEFMNSDENIAISPVNMYVALSMLAETTDGASREQILSLTGTDSIENLRSVSQSAWNALYEKSDMGTLILANSLWLSDAYEYNAEAVDALAGYHYAEAFSGKMGDASYNRSLQNWINDKTEGLLEEQAQTVQLDERTVLELISTIYYKSGWIDAFTEDNTEVDTFHAATGDQEYEFMNSSAEMVYYHGDGIGAVAKELSDGSTMWFFLTDEGTDIKDAICDGAVTKLITDGLLSDYADYATVNFSVPKFDICSDIDMTDALINLGVTDVFSDAAADFTPLTDGCVSLSSAAHAARVRIDEEGIEAAAYTEFAVRETALLYPEDEVDFVLDRPFAFVIQNSSGIVTFAGVVNTLE